MAVSTPPSLETMRDQPLELDGTKAPTHQVAFRVELRRRVRRSTYLTSPSLPRQEEECSP